MSTDPGCARRAVALSQRAGGYAEASFTDCTDCVEKACPQMPQIVADELNAA